MIKKNYCAEKRERGIYALLSLSDADELTVKASDYGVKICDSDIVTVTFSDGGEIESIEVDVEETQKRKAEAKKRLSSLFDKR